MAELKKLDFQPLAGLSSKHLQMIISAYLPSGIAPQSDQLLIDIGDNDKLCCEVSVPPQWTSTTKTIALIHGLGGSHSSGYMVRMARKLFQNGYKVVRINLRGCGSGKGLSKIPYNAGNSEDVLNILQHLKMGHPESEIILIGFSLGANTALKFAGELHQEAATLLKMIIAVCTPFDLESTVMAIQKKGHSLYHRYYLQKIFQQASPWIHQKIHSLYEFDDKITGPLWGFGGAQEYYQQCSCIRYLNHIKCESHLLFANDDPFVALDALKTIPLPPQVHLWLTEQGSHMGFLGRTSPKGSIQWMDDLLLQWVEEVFLGPPPSLHA